MNRKPHAVSVIAGIAGILLVLALIMVVFFNFTSEKPTPSAENTAQTIPSKPETDPEEATQTHLGEAETGSVETTIVTETASAETTTVTVPPSETETQPHAHSYKETVVDATCTTNGYTVHECSCGDRYTNSETEALGHKYSSETISPTTSSKGYDLYTCSTCGDQYKDNYTDSRPNSTEPEQTEPTNPTEPEETDLDDTKKIEYCQDCGLRLKSEAFPYGCFKFSSDTECECGVLVRAGKCHNHYDTGGGYEGGGGTPETEDYGFCPDCGRRFWTTWYPQGCFSYLVDTVCECGVLVHAMECHYHGEGYGFPADSEETESIEQEKTEPAEPSEAEEDDPNPGSGENDKTNGEGTPDTESDGS